MHEFSIAESLLNAVLAELTDLDPPAARVKAVQVAVGDMRQIVPETLCFAFETMAAETPARGSQLNLRHIPITADCRTCRWRGTVVPPVFLCPKCDGGDLEMLTGQELCLEKLEIEQDE